MRHEIVCPTSAEAFRLASNIVAEGWHARATTAHGQSIVLALAPDALVRAAIRTSGIAPGVRCRSHSRCAR